MNSKPLDFEIVFLLTQAPVFAYDGCESLRVNFGFEIVLIARILKQHVSRIGAN